MTWPILGVIRTVLRAIRRRGRSSDVFGVGAGIAALWAVLVGLLALLLTVNFWYVPHTYTLQFYGRHPRPGFWILMAAAAPGALVALWGVAAWGIPGVLRGLLLFVPRPAPKQRSVPLKTPEEIAALEREVGIE